MALDLELSINILKELFGDNVLLRFCFFHLRCRLSAKFREKGFRQILASEEYKQHLALCYNLAFMPTKEVEIAFENHAVPSLLSVAGVTADEFIEYLRNTYFGTCVKEAMYPISMWNMADEVFNDVAQVTNNVSERFNVVYNKAQGNSKSFTTAIKNLHEITCFQEVKVKSMDRRAFNIRKMADYNFIKDFIKNYNKFDQKSFF